MKDSFDVVVIGAGPGGYVAAIRASQLGKTVAIVEEDKLGGVCLNKGCIPTKALLKSAHMVHEVKEMASLGIDVELKGVKGDKAVQRANKISQRISKGVGFLMKKNKITVIEGKAKLLSPQKISVQGGQGRRQIEGKKVIIATGARYRSFPGLTHDGDRLIGAWEAVKLETLPKSVGIIGAGAIGVEFAYFWNAFGVEVHIFELQDHLLPLEDLDSSLEVEKAYKKYGIKTSLGIQGIEAKNQGNKAICQVTDKEGEKKSYQFDKVLIAVGMKGNIEDLGLEAIGVKTDRNFIQVDEMGQTSVDGVYAIGDVSGPPLLAHAASHQGVIAAEHLAGQNPHPLDPLNIPACTYCVPQVASLGYTEAALKEKGIKYKVGKMPFVANGKALASNEKEGHVKVLMGQYGELLGAHIVGVNATELIHEYTLFRSMEGIDQDIYHTVHPHPTLGEWLSEAVMNANGRSLNY